MSTKPGQAQTFEINPYVLDQSKDGRYDIVFVDAVYADYPSPLAHKIPSSLYAANTRGLDHFVCVKDTGDIYLHANLNTWIPDPAKNQITWECTGGAITYPALGDNRLTAKLSSATPGKYPVTMKLDGNVLWEGVVWVVWAQGQKVGDLPIATSQVSVTTGNTTAGPGILIEGGFDFRFTISPLEVCKDYDHPDLAGPNQYRGHTIDAPGSQHFLLAANGSEMTTPFSRTRTTYHTVHPWYLM